MTFSRLGIFIIVDADQKNVAAMAPESGRVIPGTDLVQLGVGGHIPFEFDHENGKFGILPGQINDVGIPSTAREF